MRGSISAATRTRSSRPSTDLPGWPMRRLASRSPQNLLFILRRRRGALSRHVHRVIVVGELLTLGGQWQGLQGDPCADAHLWIIKRTRKFRSDPVQSLADGVAMQTERFSDFQVRSVVLQENSQCRYLLGVQVTEQRLGEQSCLRRVDQPEWALPQQGVPFDDRRRG